jgi:hypothetical protein
MVLTSLVVNVVVAFIAFSVTFIVFSVTFIVLSVAFVVISVALIVFNVVFVVNDAVTAIAFANFTIHALPKCLVILNDLGAIIIDLARVIFLATNYPTSTSGTYTTINLG